MIDTLENDLHPNGNRAVSDTGKALPIDSSRSGAGQPNRMFSDLRAMIALKGLVQPRSRFGLPIESVADLAALLRRQRSNLGLSQAELAKRAGVGRRFVSELEGGKSTVQLDVVLKVLSACGLTLVGQKVTTPGET